MEKLTENHKHSTLLALCEMFKRNVCEIITYEF